MLHARDQLVHQQWDVFHTLAQRRHFDREDVQAIVEVLTEGPLFDHLFQILVGRGNDPNIGILRAVAADALECALLQYTKKLDLHG